MSETALIGGWRVKAAYSLAFLFPLLAVTTRHAAGVLFALAFLLSCSILDRRAFSRLCLEELTILGVVLALFLSCMISSLISGWDENATRGLGIQIRYLAFIPIYLMLKRVGGVLNWFLWGSLSGAILLGLQSMSEVFLDDAFRAVGPYNSPGFLGVHALLFFLLLALTIGERNRNVPSSSLWALGILFALVALSLSGSRSTYLTTALLVVILPFLLRPRSGLFLSAALASFFIIAFISIDLVSWQVVKGLQEATSGVTSSALASASSGEISSPSLRLEMWRASIHIFSDNPFWGIGWRNFSTHALPLVEKYDLHPLIASTPHPHNAYLNALVSTGFVGLVLFSTLMFLPVLVAHRKRLVAPSTAPLLSVFGLLFLINSVNEGGTLIYNNTSSIYLFSFAVLLSSTILEECKPRPN